MMDGGLERFELLSFEASLIICVCFEVKASAVRKCAKQGDNFNGMEEVHRKIVSPTLQAHCMFDIAKW